MLSSWEYLPLCHHTTLGWSLVGLARLILDETDYGIRTLSTSVLDSCMLMNSHVDEPSERGSVTYRRPRYLRTSWFGSSLLNLSMHHPVSTPLKVLGPVSLFKGRIMPLSPPPLKENTGVIPVQLLTVDHPPCSQYRLMIYIGNPVGIILFANSCVYR